MERSLLVLDGGALWAQVTDEQRALRSTDNGKGWPDALDQSLFL